MKNKLGTSLVMGMMLAVSSSALAGMAEVDKAVEKAITQATMQRAKQEIVLEDFKQKIGDIAKPEAKQLMPVLETLTVFNGVFATQGDSPTSRALAAEYLKLK